MEEEEKLEEERGFRRFLPLLITLLLIAGGFCALWFTEGRALLYRFPVQSRLRCAVELTVDGKAFPLSDGNISPLTMVNGKENKINSVKQTDSGAVIRCIGGQYGVQPFQISVQPDGAEEPIRIPVKVSVANWWEITSLELHIALDTAAGQYTYEGTCKMYRSQKPVSGEGSLEYPDIRISGI